MARSTDPKKVALWRGRFRRFVDSSLSVVRFCAAEGVSEASFYYWQKKLGLPKRRRRARARDRAHACAGRYVCAKDHGGGSGRRQSGAEARADRSKRRRAGTENRGDGPDGRPVGHPDATGGGMFQPVTVLPATCGLVVRLPGGTRIEVDAAHLEAIRAVVAETVRADHDLTTVRGACAKVHESGSRLPSNNHDGGRRSPFDNHLIRTNDEGVSC